MQDIEIAEDNKILSLDTEGNIIERTRSLFPYSYSDFTLWSKYGKNELGTSSVYTDRIHQWASEKGESSEINSLLRKHLGSDGDVWDSSPPEKIETFLKEYTGAPFLELIRIVQSVNVSSGSPLWRLDYRTIPSQKLINMVLLDLGGKLLKPSWRKRWSPDCPQRGYCYMVSEAIYHLTERTLKPYCIKFNNEDTHWFLKDQYGNIIDLTSEQFGSVPYDAARAQNFLKGGGENGISKNGKEILDLICRYASLKNPPERRAR